MLYAVVLTIHSWLRWLVLLTGIVAFVRSAVGTSRRTAWTTADDHAGFWFSTVLDAQFLLGLVLYIFLSPFTHAAFRDIGGAMGNSALRFWLVEHVFGMIVGLALVHVGRVRARKTDSLRRHRVVAIFFGLALVAILVSIPWPGMPAGRPLLRW
jgi:hypothetical protein